MATRQRPTRSLFDMNARSVRAREGASPALRLSRIGRPVYQYERTGSTEIRDSAIANQLPERGVWCALAPRLASRVIEDLGTRGREKALRIQRPPDEPTDRKGFSGLE